MDGNKGYWNELAEEIEAYCAEYSILHTNFFYHEKLVAQKREMNNTVSLIESISFRWYALLILSRILMKSMIYYSIIECVKKHLSSGIFYN